MLSVKPFLMKTIICLCFIVTHLRSVFAFSENNNSICSRLSPDINSNGCLLPQHPRFGQWSVYLSTSQLHPGMSVPLGTVLQIRCQNNYKLDGDASVFCLNGRWSAEVGECLKTCPPIYSTSTMKVTCTLNKSATENCTDAVDRTVAEFKCADFYEDHGLEKQPFRVCYNGRWSQNIPECVPVCGQKSVKNNPTLIVNGSSASKGDYPWQVAIYNKTDTVLICGGSLINQRVILTAAHCITDEKGKMESEEFYIVAVGKYYRNYDDSRDNEAQFSSIDKMFIPRRYKGYIQNYVGDIAILVTQKTFSLSRWVQPVCVDWAAKYQRRLLDPTKVQYGYVTGWGYTVQHKKPSNVLKKLKIPLVTETKCMEDIPEDYEQYLTDDKLCAGYLNSGTSVCKGDSGGGLVFKHKKIFYIAAVVSLSPLAPTRDGGCDSQQYAFYTKVYDYIESFILEKEATFRPSSFENVDCYQNPNCNEETTTASTSTEESITETPKSNQFQCRSGQSIHENLKCDGKADCDDHSDEITATCRNVPCPGFAYRCQYGGCVGGNAECNGIVDCFDGSDEDPTNCKTVPFPTPTPRPPPDKPGDICTLPEHPEFGAWTVYRNQQRLLPGMYVTEGSVLKVTCNAKHKLDGNSTIFCELGKWTSPIGKCLELCPPRSSTHTMTVTCIYKNDKETENCTDAVDGTLAKFKCAPYYEDFGLKRRPIHICKDGTWDRQTPRCLPVCGQKTVDAQTLIINGSPVKKSDYPWQVALYTVKDKLLICGGSLINQRVVLTAAHCVADDNGNLLSKEHYIVAVGKYYRQYNDSRDFNEAQFSELTAIFIPEEYRGAAQNYFGDIAILVTKKVFVLSRRVQPVCVDYGQNFNDLEINEFGYITGWGYTAENSKPSEVLKELKVPYVSFEQCRQSLPEDFDIYLTHDKLCAGYLNNSSSVCDGDGGGGLVFKNNGRYYIVGIMSLSPRSLSSSLGECDSQQYSLYTKISNYVHNFILQKENQFRP